VVRYDENGCDMTIFTSYHISALDLYLILASRADIGYDMKTVT